MRKLQGCIDRGLQAVASEQKQVKEYVNEVKRVEATLDPSKGSSEQRKKRYDRLKRRLRNSQRAPIFMRSSGLLMMVLSVTGRLVS